METLNLKISTKRLFNELNNYGIFAGICLDTGNRVAIKGYFQELYKGDHVTANGVWDKPYVKNGKTYKTATLNTSSVNVYEPKDSQGIVKYLTATINGVGKVMAERILEHFGTDIFSILDNMPSKLREVEGITADKLIKIESSWKAERASWTAINYINSVGFSYPHALAVFREFGETYKDVIDNDLYLISSRVRQIGFLEVDKIGRRLGHKSTDKLRIKGGVHYIFSENKHGKGNTAVEYNNLLDSVNVLLNLKCDTVYNFLDDGIKFGKFVIFKDGESTIIQTAKMARLENEIEMKLRRLKNNIKIKFSEIEKRISVIDKITGFSLNAGQKEAVIGALNNKAIIMTGGPGTGKTTITEYITKLIISNRKTVALCAPTGAAADKMSQSTGLPSSTIHRLLGFDFEGNFKKGESNFIDADFVIVDEGSMIDTELFHKLVCAIKPKSHLILIGDTDQLESVGAGKVLDDLIQSKSIPVFEITEIMRQALDSKIVEVAHKINKGDTSFLDEKTTSFDFSFYNTDCDEVTAGYINAVMSSKKLKESGYDFKRDVQILTPVHAGIIGTTWQNNNTQEFVNPRGKSIERAGVSFRVDDNVMNTRNDKDKKVFNGNIGKIVDVSEKLVTVEFKDGDGVKEVEYTKGELIDLMLSYCITVHKSQGSEYKCVILNIPHNSGVLTRQLIYTAATRAKEKLIIVGSKMKIKEAIKKNGSSKRITGLKNKLANI